MEGAGLGRTVAAATPGHSCPVPQPAFSQQHMPLPFLLSHTELSTRALSTMQDMWEKLIPQAVWHSPRAWHPSRAAFLSAYQDACDSGVSGKQQEREEQVPLLP